ncbi:hypothetical protein KL925_001582 [Ogataea polymorpha]|nr:hypothetical protein KL936_001581 [Ogataea polymorpha]KAG7928282.1 hypothetical protein KL925_001582 [Ogataea polymorpha]
MSIADRRERDYADCELRHLVSLTGCRDVPSGGEEGGERGLDYNLGQEGGGWVPGLQAPQTAHQRSSLPRAQAQSHRQAK